MKASTYMANTHTHTNTYILLRNSFDSAFIFHYYTVSKVPLLKELYQYITPQYATHWKVIGTQLGLSTGALDIIENDNMYKAVQCCNNMLKKWLEVDTTASWQKLFKVIESLTMCWASYNGT